MCLQCGIITSNPKFCSKSCAASYNNRVYPKRHFTCRRCGLTKRPRTPRSTLCYDCGILYKERMARDWELGELRERYSLHHRASLHSYVRLRARNKMRNLGRNTCEECGYNKHVEIAHVKPMSSYPDTARISEVNSLDNLRALCPNCHWEFDNPS